MHNHHDLIIIGAGPAGLSTAMHLCQLDPGWSERLLVIEKSAHPRPKLCGGGLTRFGIRALQDLDIPWPLPIDQVNVNEAVLLYDHRVVCVRAQPEIVIFHRPQLDAYLADRARTRGIKINENETARSFEINAQGVELTTSQAHYTSQVLVGADGAKGIVRQAINRLTKRKHTARALEIILAHHHNVVTSSADQALFDFTPTRHHLQGYFWQFPLKIYGKPSSNVGVYDARISRNLARADLLDVLLSNANKHHIDLGNQQHAGHPVHWFSPRNIFRHERLLLVGDAAGVDPLFGEGIGPSLAYGKIAAQAIQQAFAARDFHFSRYPRMLMGSELGKYLLVRWAVAWWAYRLKRYPGFMPLVWRLGNILVHILPKPPPL